MWKKNVGGIDRVLRVIIGIAIIGAGVYFSSWWGLLGVALLGTAIFKRCFLYNIIGVSTCPVDTPKSPEAKTDSPAS